MSTANTKKRIHYKNDHSLRGLKGILYTSDTRGIEYNEKRKKEKKTKQRVHYVNNLQPAVSGGGALTRSNLSSTALRPGTKHVTYRSAVRYTSKHGVCARRVSRCGVAGRLCVWRRGARPGPPSINAALGARRQHRRCRCNITLFPHLIYTP